LLIYYLVNAAQGQDQQSKTINNWSRDQCLASMTVSLLQCSPHFTSDNDKDKLSCRRETARCFVLLLNISSSHSRSLEMTPLSRACVSPFWYYRFWEIQRQTLAWLWNRDQRSFNVVENSAVRYDLLLVCHRKYSYIFYHFQVIWR